MYSLLLLAISSLGLSITLTPLVRRLSLWLGLVDKPDKLRRLHDHPIPRTGGIVIALAYTLAFALLLMTKLKGGILIWHAFPLISKLLPAAALIFLIGLIDDLLPLKPWQKLLGQTVGAVVAWLAGIRIFALQGEQFTSIWWSLPVTIIWLVGCTNAVNLIDGMDGLAAGLGFVATTTTVLAAALQGNVELLLATVPLAGCLLGFLRYNFNPATIFLGDSGSLFVGFLLGCYGVLWSQKSATLLGMTAPLMALAIPLLDTVVAIARRFLRREPIFGADRGHIHHLLIDRGFTPRRAALLLYGTGALAALFSLSLVSFHFQVPVILIFCITAWIGIQRLGYLEFDTAGKMLRSGSFRQLLDSHITLRTLEAKLTKASSSEECWILLRAAAATFGFTEICLQIGGFYRSEQIQPIKQRTWNILIPLSEDDYVQLMHDFESNARHNCIASFVDVVRRSLEAKANSQFPDQPLHFSTNNSETLDSGQERWDTASANN